MRRPPGFSRNMTPQIGHQHVIVRRATQQNSNAAAAADTSIKSPSDFNNLMRAPRRALVTARGFRGALKMRSYFTGSTRLRPSQADKMTESYRSDQETL
jgi:hypothetical protein